MAMPVRPAMARSRAAPCRTLPLQHVAARHAQHLVAQGDLTCNCDLLPANNCDQPIVLPWYTSGGTQAGPGG